MNSIKPVVGFVLGTLFIVSLAILWSQYSAVMKAACFSC